MSRIGGRILTVSFVVAAVGGCMRPVSLDLRTQQPVAANVTLRLVKGKGAAPAPASCATPCMVQIAPGTTNEVALRAPGYYPATFELTYDGVLAAGRGRKATLVVPLQERGQAAEAEQGALHGGP